uniref:F-box associated beta-propeller type 3 domain-containing protein n=1 Tax=Brassica campestris TaxID=3711 RepID=M4E104_BRACM
MFVSHQSLIRSSSSSQPFHLYPMEVPGKHCYFSCMDSVHGLICINGVKSKVPLVWNPTMGQLLALPKPKMSSRHADVFLGYDSIVGKHKVVCLPHRKTCYVCRVFTLGSGQKSWRTVRTNFKHCVEAVASGQCIIKGMIYYLACNRQGYGTVVMSFDVRSEIFHMIELPSSIHWDVLMTYEGKIACIDEDNDKRLWRLEDATDKHKWSFQDFLSPVYKFFELQGFTHAGEFIYVPFKFYKSSYIKFYDPVRNICRSLNFEEIVEENFGQSVKAFPNHIESLMPFTIFCIQITTVLIVFSMLMTKVRVTLSSMNAEPSPVTLDKGRLACIDEDNDKRLWRLEDASDKHKWSFQNFLSPLNKLFEVQGSTHAGCFKAFPNHIESLMPL